jgi:pyrroline-5-carboxylate reductase
MGSAIAKALAKKGSKVFVYDTNPTKARVLNKFGIVFDLNLKHLSSADYIILAVKPYHLAETGADVAGKIKPSTVVISIAAGVTLSKLQKIFNHKKVVRMMPNLGLSVDQGIAAWIPYGLSNIEKPRVKKLMDKFTENFEVKKENEIDAVTAISGSGPAYFFAFARAMEKAAQNLGFSAAVSRKLVEKTFSASALLQESLDYQQLIDIVASKKGTTEQAIKSFKKSNLDKIVLQAVKAAQKRAIEISRE